MFFSDVRFLFSLQSLDAPSLQSISLTLNSNQLLAVIGPVGAGKVRHLLVMLCNLFSLSCSCHTCCYKKHFEYSK